MKSVFYVYKKKKKRKSNTSHIKIRKFDVIAHLRYKMKYINDELLKKKKKKEGNYM